MAIVSGAGGSNTTNNTANIFENIFKKLKSYSTSDTSATQNTSNLNNTGSIFSANGNSGYASDQAKNDILTKENENNYGNKLGKLHKYDINNNLYYSYENKAKDETEKLRQDILSGNVDENKLADFNSKYGVILDTDNKAVDQEQYKVDVEKYNNNAEKIFNTMNELNREYQQGRIVQDLYDLKKNELKTKYDQNEILGNKLRSYQVKQGFDYYDWAKENGIDVSDFEKYAESFDDSYLEKLGSLYAASWLDTIATVPQTYNVLKSIITNDASAITDENSFVSKLESTANELREYGYSNTDGAKQWSLQTIESLMPMINSMIVGKGVTFGKATTDTLNTFTNVFLGTQTAGQVAKQRLLEGNDLTTSVINGALHGTITALVEGLDAGKIASVFTGDAEKFLLSNALFSKASFGQIAGYLNSIGASEGTEEIVEAIADYFADSLQNEIIGAMNGDTINKINVEKIDPKDLANQFVMAYAGATLLGIPTSARVVINSKQKYNAAIQAKYSFQSTIDSPLASKVEKDMAVAAIQAINEDITTYKNNSLLGDAITSTADDVAPAVSYDEAMNNLVNAIQNDVKGELKTAQQTLDNAQNLKNMIDTELRSRGFLSNKEETNDIKGVSTDTYLKMSQDMKNETKDLLNLSNAIGADVKVDDNFNVWQNGKIINKVLGNNYNGANANKGNIAINPFSNNVKKNGSGILKSTLAHELVHNIKDLTKLKELVRKKLGDSAWLKEENYVKEMWKGDINTQDQIDEEIIARYFENNFGNEQFLSTIAKYDNSIITRIYNGFKSLVDVTGKSEIANEFFKQYSNYMNSSEMSLDGGTKMSVGTLAQSMNMETQVADDNHHIQFTYNGKVVDKVTSKMIEKSSLGNLLKNSTEKGLISKAEYKKQLNMFAQMMNTIKDTQDPQLYWAISGSLAFTPVSTLNGITNDMLNETKSTNTQAYTGNADPQYNRTFDVTTICNKTQQLINAMSETMMKLGRGLTREEIINVAYDEVFKAGEPVPCPVCYVFSRWVGIGGLLQRINNCQELYSNMSNQEIKHRMEVLDNQINDIIERNGYKDSKAKKEVLFQLNKELSDINYKEQKGETLTDEELSRRDILEKDIGILDERAWIEDVRLSDNYKPVPNDILFDLNKGEIFSQLYPETWKWRTTRGSGMGKAITPYSSEVLGQTIIGTASNNDFKKLGQFRNSDTNPFLQISNGLNKEASSTLDKAIENAKKQNIIGGSRLQSTSDMRFEYVTDYIVHLLELQSEGSYAQEYTKVPESVGMLASCGVSINCSVMPLKKGYSVSNSKNAIKLDINNPIYSGLNFEGFDASKKYKLDFSPVTGMNKEDAFGLSSRYDSVQPIMVGINDPHIALCMESVPRTVEELREGRITQIIPYHASGNQDTRFKKQMDIVGEEIDLKDRTDYAPIEHDSINPNSTQEQNDLRQLRLDIIMGNAFDLNNNQKALLNNNSFLNNLYNRFYIEGYDAELYNTFLNKAQADVIFPYEYWDKTSTIENADINGENFVKYCESLGITPRFEKFSKLHGYWTTLIDRSMYDLNGNYLSQKPINVSNMSVDYLFRNKMIEGIVQPSQQFDPSKTSSITSNILDRISDNLQFSKGIDDNYGYHYGAKEFDLNKKSETLGVRGGRGTGAFGTGTYFFGNKQEPSKYGYNDGKRVEHKVDFSNYNLFKVQNDNDGYALHDYFKKLDDYYDYNGYTDEKELENKFKSYYDIGESIYENGINANDFDILVSDLEKTVGSSQTGRILSNSTNEELRNELEWSIPDMNGTYDFKNNRYVTNKELLQIIDTEKLSNELAKLSSNYNEQEYAFDKLYGYKYLENNIEKVANILNVSVNDLYVAQENAIATALNDTKNKNFYTDSLGTRVMKNLGYEGIDVRGTNLDNSTYGSVIYDLKPSTIQYSKGLTSEDKYVESVQNVVSKANNIIDDNELTVENIDDIVQQRKVNPETIKAVEKAKKVFTENMKDWVKGYDTIKAQYPNFSEETFNDAIFESLVYGDLSDKTYNAMANTLSAEFELENFDGNVKQSVYDFVQEALETFKNEARYKAGETDNKAVRNAIKLDQAYKTWDKSSDISYEYINTLNGRKLDEISANYKEMLRKKDQPLVNTLLVNDRKYRELKGKASDTGNFDLKTPEQVARFVAHGDKNLYSALSNRFYEQYQNALKSKNELRTYEQSIIDKFKELGIVKNSKEAQAAQWIREGHTENYRKDLDLKGKEVTQETIEEFKKQPYEKYTLDDLKKDFNKKASNGKMVWENILEAAALQQEAYDYIYYLDNKSRILAYGDVLGHKDLKIAEAKTKLENAFTTMESIKNEIVKNGSKPETQAAYEIAKNNYNSLLTKFNALMEKDNNNELTNRQLVPYRANYVHHIIKNGTSIKNLFTNKGSQIPTQLAGITDTTEPNSRFVTYSIARENGRYDADAVASFEAYMNEAINSIAYAPTIIENRQLVKDIRDTAINNELSKLESWLTRYTNNIAGKRYWVDRGISDSVSDVPVKVIRKLGSLNKAATLMFNPRSALVQISNLPEGQAIIVKNGGKGSAKDLGKGLISFINNKFGGKDSVINQSKYFNDKYYTKIETYDKSITKTLKNWSSAMMEALDKVSAEYIWESAFAQGERLLSEGKTLEYGNNAIEYADAITQQAIPSRDISQVPIALQSQVISAFAPYQVEVNNIFQNELKNASEGKVSAIMVYQAAAFLINMLFKSLYGKDDEILSEFITPIVKEFGKFNDGEQDIRETLLGIGKGEVAEAISSLPFASLFTSLIWNEEESDELFSEYNPNKYGNTNIAFAGLGDIFKDLFDSDLELKDKATKVLKDAISSYMAGGKQLVRTIEGVDSMLNPIQRDSKGNIKWVNDQKDIKDWIRASLFGKSNTSAANDYYEGNRTLSEKETRIFDLLNSNGSDAETYKDVSTYRDNKNEAKKQKEEGNKDYDETTLREQLIASGKYGDYKNAVSEAYGDYVKNWYKEKHDEDEEPKSFKEFANTYGISSNDLKLDTYGDFYNAYNVSKDVQKVFSDALEIENTVNSLGKTITNSAATQRRVIYENAGIYEQILEYIEDNNLEYSDFGLTKTVVGYNASNIKKMLSKIGSTLEYNGKGESKGTSSTSEDKRLKGMKAYMKALKSANSDVFSYMKNMTTIEDAKKNAENVRAKYKK